MQELMQEVVETQEIQEIQPTNQAAQDSQDTQDTQDCGTHKSVRVLFEPLQDRVLVYPLESSSDKDSLIEIPEAFKEKTQFGIVLAVGPGMVLTDGTRYATSVVNGDEIMFRKRAGDEVVLNGEKRLLMKEHEILGIIRRYIVETDPKTTFIPDDANVQMMYNPNAGLPQDAIVENIKQRQDNTIEDEHIKAQQKDIDQRIEKQQRTLEENQPIFPVALVVDKRRKY